MASRTAPSLITSPAAFSAALTGWYRVHARRLPWRTAPSVYKTVVSEFMLQQTQVKTVLPYFARWTAEWPGFDALAAAPESRVLRLWEGLGYYARARNLHRLARELLALPEPPSTLDSWEALPGVGPYTAAAIASIGFGIPAACVDGNVVRILARLTADATEFRDGATAAKAFTPLAARLISTAGWPGEHNQAMMELGATVCLRQNPLCGECPVRPFCAATRRGNPAALPRFSPKPTVRRSVTRVWCERAGSLLLHRAAAGARRLAGLHELPTAEQAGVARRSWPPGGRSYARNSRSITKYRFIESIHAVAPPRGLLKAGVACGTLAALDGISFSGPHRRWVTEILAKRLKSAPQSAPSNR